MINDVAGNASGFLVSSDHGTGLSMTGNTITGFAGLRITDAFNQGTFSNNTVDAQNFSGVHFHAGGGNTIVGTGNTFSNGTLCTGGAMAINSQSNIDFGAAGHCP